MEESKEEFLRQYGEDYGYPNSAKGIDDIRSSEFKRLDGLAYLDHAGAGLYSETQMEAVLKDLTLNVYGNPHSQSDASLATSEAIRVARQLVLEYCNASPKDYKCIFTSGATAALKLVGEAFPWSRESCYMYTMENHNSVLGIREYALDRGAAALAIEVEEVESLSGPSKGYGSSFKVLQHPVQRRAVASTEDSLNGETCHLFAFPSECNFTGMKFSMDLVNIVKEDREKILKGSFCRGRWMVLIDAAKGCATQPPDLSRFPADFVVLSFYKIFGYPSGLGALIARTEAAKMLKKTYFSGGTVSASIANIDFVKRREGIEELLEDGTQSFLNISSIRHGFNIINTLTTSAIVRHTTMLASYVRNTLMALRHENGAVVCTIYGSNIGKVLNLGPTIAFNLKRPDGSWFGYREVEKLASLSGIQLRTGCFCNPGACAKYLGLSTADLLSNVEAGRVCWDDNDILHGKPTGAVRVSFGYMSTFEDAKKFIMFIRHSFVVVPYIIGSGHKSRKKIFSGIGRRHLARSLHLKSITVYPIKSCSGFCVDRWALNNTGLQYDREWLIRGINGDIFTQKKVPEMRLINTIIDLNLGKLFVESPRCKVKLEINLDQNLSCCEKEELELLGQRYQVQGYDDEVNMWFAEALARPCMLLRYCGSEYLNPVTKKCRPQTCRDEQSRLNFVNEAQFLLISEESVCDLNDRLSSNARKGKYGPGQNIHVDAMRFRPNLIMSGAEPYEEDSWRRLTIGGTYFTSLGGCNRCEMINLDFQSGEVRKSKEPLATLASFRRVKGKILFGILLRYDSSSNEYEGGNEETWLEVGQKVHPDMS